MKLQQVYWHNDKNEIMGEDNFKYCPLCGNLLIQKYIDKLSRQTCPECGYVHFRNPSPTVSLFIVSKEKVLLGTRSTHPGKDRWATPSGYIEFNEDFQATAIREAKEETSLDIETMEILNVTDSFFPPDLHFINIYLLAHAVGGELKPGDDMGKLEWFPIAGPLPEMAFQEDVDLIEKYRNSVDQHNLEK